MERPIETQTDFVRRLLAFESRAATSGDARADAAAALFDKTFAALAPIVGADGVDAIFKRTVRMTQQGFPCLDLVVAASTGERLDPRQCLRRCQREEDAAHFFDVAAGLYARFFAAIAALIGERLTSRIVAMAWPDVTLGNTGIEEKKG